MKTSVSFASLLTLAVLLCNQASAGTFTFTTGTPDGLIATGSRPSSLGKLEIESADDFVLSQAILLNHATFTGLINSNLATVTGVNVEIYRVFPLDSSVPESGNVPTRANSPSDVAFSARDSGSAQLSFSTTLLNENFAASNSILNGINKQPNQMTGGEGPVSGQEVQFDVALNLGILLPAGHYFFVPQVTVEGGDFFWLSTARPAGGLFLSDLQSWIRNENLAPDWERIGTDITGQGPFNASFSLSGKTPSLSPVPEPSTFGLFGITTLLLAGIVRKVRSARRPGLTTA